MVEFEYQPWKKIIIHEVAKYSKEFLITSHSLGVNQGGVGRPITWVNGFLYEFSTFRDTDEIIKDKLEGKVHWTFLHYAILEKYQPEFKVEGNIRIPVINVSDNETFQEMASWIKENFEKEI